MLTKYGISYYVWLIDGLGLITIPYSGTKHINAKPYKSIDIIVLE